MPTAESLELLPFQVDYVIQGSECAVHERSVACLENVAAGRRQGKELEKRYIVLEKKQQK